MDKAHRLELPPPVGAWALAKAAMTDAALAYRKEQPLDPEAPIGSPSMAGSLTLPIVDSRIEERAARRLSEAPVTVQGILRRAYEGSASPRQAIKAFCLQCTGYDREAVRKCTAPACPLFAYRPFVASDPRAQEKTREALTLAKEAEECRPAPLTSHDAPHHHQP